MSVKNQRRDCAYCGELKKLTDDHVPPKLFLAAPFPPNLITVPACRECNSSFAKDDEYTRTLLGLDVRSMRNSTAQKNVDAVVRSLQRPEASKFTAYIDRNSENSVVLNYMGAPLGRHMVVDRQRINNSGLHMIRGLYYAERKSRPKEGADMKIMSATNLTPDDKVLQWCAVLMDGLIEKTSKVIGDGFSYCSSFGYGVSIWMILLYNCHFWLGTIDERAANDRDKDLIENAQVSPEIAAQIEKALAL